MKKIMITLALLLTLGTSFAFRGEAVNDRALNAFKNEFAGATDIAWTIGKNYYKVAFTLNDKKQFAFYNNDGEFIAVTRFLTSLQLPHNLQKSLRKSYRNYWISDLFEMATGEETLYYITLENADVKIVLRSINGSCWSLYHKIDKE